MRSIIDEKTPLLAAFYPHQHIIHGKLLRREAFLSSGHRFKKNIIPTGVRWYLVYPLSDRHLATGKICPLQHRAMPSS
jgi:hypothetical protein